MERAVLFFHYLCKLLQTNCDNKKKAKVINFFTGYSENTTGQKFSNLFEKANTNFQDFEDDFGGKVFTVFSRDGEIANRNVIQEIEREIDRLKTV